MCELWWWSASNLTVFEFLFLSLISLSLFHSLSLTLSLSLSSLSFQHTPAIGHIVILASFTGMLWAELAPSYLAEGFDRQVSRIVQRHPELNTSQPDAKIDATRISVSFQATNLSGLRFLMTQLTFNRSAVLYTC